MDNWGQGPWFEPEADEEQGGAGSGGQQVIEQPTIQRRATGGPAATLPPLPGVASRPLPLEAGRSGTRGPLSATDVAGMPPEQTPAVPGAVAGASGSFRRPTMPSRPANPNVAPDAGADGQPWDASGAHDGYTAYAPPSRPLTPPIPAPPGQLAWDYEILPSGTPPAGTPPKRGKRGKRGDGGGRGRPLMFWPVFVGLALLLVACSAIGLISSGVLGRAGASAVRHALVATATATNDPNATPTPVPPPNAATLSFVPASQQVASPAAMTSCPNGCDLAGQTYSNSQGFSYDQFKATQIAQSALTGIIHAVNNSTTKSWDVQAYQFSGGGYSCAPQDISLPPTTSNDYVCFVSRSSPQVIAAHTIEGTASTDPQVLFTQPNQLTGNGYYQVLSSDCQSALSSLHGQGTAWASGWIGGQTIPTGWNWARSQVLITFSGDSCPLGNKQSTPNFTASTTASVQNSAYAPAAAQALAASRLDGALPRGYQWKGGSRSTCAPAVSDVAGDGKVTLTCSDAGTAAFVWGDAQRSRLASDVAGQSKAKALAICNGREGVRSGSCAVAIQGGDGSVLPKDATAVTVNVGAP